jgi:hypothetical protein
MELPFVVKMRSGWSDMLINDILVASQLIVALTLFQVRR